MLFYFRHALASLLPAIASAYSNHVLHDAHLHSLVTIWTGSQDEFSSAEFCEVVFDNFLLTMLSQEGVLRQTLRLLHFVYPKMESNKVIAILTTTQPSPEVGLVGKVLGKLGNIVAERSLLMFLHFVSQCEQTRKQWLACLVCFLQTCSFAHANQKNNVSCAGNIGNMWAN